MATFSCRRPIRREAASDQRAPPHLDSPPGRLASSCQVGSLAWPGLRTGERWRGNDACSSGRAKWQRERLTGRQESVSLSGPTVGSDLPERLLAQRFQLFAETEEVTGSTLSRPLGTTIYRFLAQRRLSAAHLWCPLDHSEC